MGPGHEARDDTCFFDAARRDLDIAHAAQWVPGMKPGMTTVFLDAARAAISTSRMRGHGSRA